MGRRLTDQEYVYRELAARIRFEKAVGCFLVVVLLLVLGLAVLVKINEANGDPSDAARQQELRKIHGIPEPK